MEVLLLLQPNTENEKRNLKMLREEKVSLSLNGGQRFYVYAASGGDEKSRGIYRFIFDADRGQLSSSSLVFGGINPLFMAIHPSGRYIYATCNKRPFETPHKGRIYAFSISEENGELVELCEVSSAGDTPCHISVDKKGLCSFVANYSSSSVASFQISSDGRLSEAVSVICHEGSGEDPKRQEAPHPHSMTPDPTGSRVLAADLGLDKIISYGFDSGSGELFSRESASTSLEPISGPRHLSFSPNSPFVYSANELANTVTAFAYNLKKGSLSEIQTTKTIPNGFEGETYASELAVHPSGRFLYAANRGHDSIAAFKVNSEDGTLRFVDVFKCGGAWPQHFQIDPSGNFLLVTNKKSNEINIFRIEHETGVISETGKKGQIESPSCVCFKTYDKKNIIM